VKRRVLAFAVALGAPLITPFGGATLAQSELHARGQVLAIGTRYLVFATGDALRLRPGTVVPKGTTLGSVVLVTLDPLAHDVSAIALEGAPVAGEIAIAQVPREFVVAAPRSARPIVSEAAAPSATAAARAGSDAASPTVMLVVTVPTNTPPTDDVYVATDRSNYGPSEIRMQRIDSRRFTAAVAFDVNGRVKYQYTRGSYATVERDRSGGIVEPHAVARPTQKIEDSVTRWADLN